jgi:hypothetical protein
VVDVVWVVVVVVVVIGVVPGADDATGHVRVKSVALPMVPAFGAVGVNETTSTLGMFTGLVMRESRPDIAGATLHDSAPGAAPVKFTTYVVPPLVELALLFTVTELIQPLLLVTAPVALIFTVCAFDCAYTPEKTTPPITNSADVVIVLAFMGASTNG